MFPGVKQPVLKLISTQVVCALVTIVAVWLFAGNALIIPAALGCASMLLASVYMTWRTFRSSAKAFDPKAVVLGMYKGAFGKYVIIGLCVFLFAKSGNPHWVTFMIGLAVVQLAIWLAPIWLKTTAPCATRG